MTKLTLEESVIAADLHSSAGGKERFRRGKGKQRLCFRNIHVLLRSEAPPRRANLAPAAIESNASFRYGSYAPGQRPLHIGAARGPSDSCLPSGAVAEAGFSARRDLLVVPV